MRTLNDKKQQGAITVFFSIILLILITLTGIIVDGARIRAAETMAREAANTALHSVLANYNQTLKEDYGLFALELKEEEVNQLLHFYLEGSMTSHESLDLSFYNPIPWDLFEYSIEALNSTSLYSLGEDPVISQQILEFMKYRAPKVLLEEGLEYFFELEKIGRAAKDLEDKLEIERELGSLAQKQLELEKIIARLKGFSIDRNVGVLANIISGAYGRIEYQEWKEEIKEQQQQVRNTLREIENPEERESYLEELEDLRSQWEEVDEAEEALEDKMAESYREAAKAVGAALEDCRQLSSISQELQQMMGEIKVKTMAMAEKLEKRQGEDKGEYEKYLKEELQGYRDFVEGEQLDQLIAAGAENQGHLEAAKAILDETYETAMDVTVDSRENLRTLDQSLNEFSRSLEPLDLSLNYEKPAVIEVSPEEAGEDKDNRKEISAKANELFQQATGKEDIVIDSATLAKLPSRGEQASDHGTEVEFDEKDKDRGYSEDSLSELYQQSSILVSGVNEIRDQLYINEYSLGTFKTALSPHGDLGYNLRNQPKDERISFFDYEVEYILYGNASQKKNLLKTKRDLVATRFVLNLIYVYQNPQLLKSATAIASLLAAPLGGAAMPLIKTMILCGWAMGYSLEDVAQIMKGERVNFYRDRDSFKLGYEDYLRLFLLRPGLDQSRKLDRIKDLIQLNLQKNPLYTDKVALSSYYTYVGMELDYSLKVLFLRGFNSQGHEPGGKDRYQIKLLQWQGY